MGKSYFFPFSLSILLHMGLAAVMVWGWEVRPEKRTIKKPNYVQATLVSLEDQSKKKKAAVKKTKKVDLTAKRKERERLERERKKAQQKKRAAERKRAEQEKQRRAEAERKRLEAEKRAQELALQQQRQQEFDKALREEEGLLLEDQYATEAQSYIAAISQRIERNWSRPPSARKGMRCELLIQLVPTGKVVSVNVAKSSGSAAFDRSAEQAVKKVDRFPEIQDMPAEIFERYYRSLRLEFIPQDLRQ